ncbi:MAG TPA: hypothetical protein VGG89_13910 [Candidatus Baltobacteraceae bacterium]|jgi:hypothetical protein
MSRRLQRSALLCLFAASIVACSRGGVSPGGPAALPPVADAHRLKQAVSGQITIEGRVTSIVPTPYFHVVVDVSGQSASVYTSELKTAKPGDTVRAVGFYNSLGNFQASSASIVSTASSSPTPSSSPLPSTSPSPVPAPSSEVPGVIKQFQVFDYDITAAQSTSNAPKMSVVWGAGIGDAGANPHTWLAGNSHLAATQYVVQPTDHYAVSHHDLAWWQSNHPDWIVYDCDEYNRPTRTVAYQPGLPQDVPLDIHNPSVVSYQIHTAAAFAIAHGANAIAADQTLFFDYDGNQQPGWFGCGVYARDGSFVRRWGAAKGGFPNYDPQWNHDVAGWVASAKTILTTDEALEPHHIKLFVNHPAGSVSNPDELTVAANVDGDVNETGFTDYGHYATSPHLFKSTLDYMELVQAKGKQALEVAKFGGGISPAQLAYAIATFLIGNEGRASLFISPGSYGEIINYPQISTVNSKLGTACGSYSTIAGGYAYERKFSGGLVIVNPGVGGTVSVSLSHAYANLMGGTIGIGALSVGPAQAYVLLTSSNGCV